MNAIELENVNKTFGQTRAVDGLSLAMQKGSICGFLGPNGAGKTTTIRMIMNIIRPDSGRIEILGGKPGLQTINNIGYMPEERGLYNKMTVTKVLDYFGTIKGIAKKELDSRIEYWLTEIELAEHAQKKVEELSRGMHQKLQFAVAAINNPDLLILDEPFSGLDPINLDLMKNIIINMRNNGKTIIFSTHAMHDAQELCNFIFLINKGKVVLEGTMDKIRSQYKSDVVSVEIDGADNFIEKLPIVKQVVKSGHRLEISLNEQADSQMLLKELVGKVKINAFEIKGLSLHEIFIKIVGDAQ
jgi:ABC-2 type transport system ATP-binding protein